MPVEAGRLPWPQAQEFQQALILRRWLVEERLALDDVYLGAREVSEHPFELVGIVAAVPVGVVAVREALVAGIGPHPVDLADEPVVLELERLLEGLPLEAAGVLVLIGGERAFDRVTEHRYQLDAGQVAGNPLDRERVVEVVPAGLEGDRIAESSRSAARDLRDREVTPVPFRAAIVVQVEVIDALVEGRVYHLRVSHDGTK